MNEEKYTGKAVGYNKYRPKYSQHLIDYLYSKCGLTATSKIADIGSGTGILSKQLLEKGSFVWGVEPNEDMRNLAEGELSKYDKFKSINANAENTTLHDSCVNFVTVGQAFHWFNYKMFKRECKRILKPEGKVILVWNIQDKKAEITKENNKICMRFCKKFSESSRNQDDSVDVFSDFFKLGKYRYMEFDNSLTYDLDKFLGINLSTSYAPSKEEKGYKEFVEELTNLFDTYQDKGVINTYGITQCYIGLV